MKRICLFFIFVLNYLSINAQTAPDTFIIQTNIGTMKGILYADMPNHVKAFKERANAGKFNGTLFTRVINGFMIQGGSPDSRNAAPGARCGYGDRSAEIMPENRTLHFHKKGALASPRQNDDINPKKKSDTSQFYIVQGRTYRSGELDTLELIKNIPIRKKAIAKYYTPIRPEMQKLKESNPAEFKIRMKEVKARIDSTLRATPGHLFFTEEQRQAYTTVGGCHSLDGEYTVFGEVTEGLDIIDKIARQPKDRYDRPTKDIRIIKVTIK